MGTTEKGRVNSELLQNDVSFVMVDVEADGQIPGDFSMVSFGAVLVEPGLKNTFKGLLKPISEKFVPEALAISGLTRENTLLFNEPKQVMEEFSQWLKINVIGTPVFISDNNGFDWMFVCWYFHHFCGNNPFGHSSVNLGNLYEGLVKDYSEKYNHLRKTKHSHDPLDDALGNAEVLLHLKKLMVFKPRK